MTFLQLWTHLQATNNLSFGFLFSESIEIFNEVFHFYPKIIAEGAIFEEKNEKDLEKIVDSERIKPKIQVNKFQKIYPFLSGYAELVAAAS